MATNTAGSVARELGFQAVHYLRANVNYSDDAGASVSLGTVPAGSIIIPNASGAFVTTAFAADTTAQTMNIGVEGGDVDSLATALVLTTAGQIELDVETAIYVTVDTPLAAALTAGTAPTAGSAEVIICYIPDNDK